MDYDEHRVLSATCFTKDLINLVNMAMVVWWDMFNNLHAKQMVHKFIETFYLSTFSYENSVAGFYKVLLYS